MGKGFICSDVAKDAEWKSKWVRKFMERMIEARQMYDPWQIMEELGFKPDRKTRQWWGKYATSKKFFDWHMFGHHVIRQTLNHIDSNPDLVLTEYLVNKLPDMRQVMAECEWTPDMEVPI